MRECELEKKEKKVQNCRKTPTERKYPSTSTPLPRYPALIFFAQHKKAAGVYAECLGIDSSAIERCLAVLRSVKRPRATAVENLSMEFQCGVPGLGTVPFVRGGDQAAISVGCEGHVCQHIELALPLGLAPIDTA